MTQYFRLTITTNGIDQIYEFQSFEELSDFVKEIEVESKRVNTKGWEGST